jgi:divalent metal cation (Fe/Co/Zn/Cd) transporter
LTQRVIEPFEYPTFVFFFIAIVIGVGGIGTWIELFRLARPQEAPDSFDGLVTSLITFFFALVGTSCTQLIIEESESKALRALGQCILVLAFVGAGVLIALGKASGQAGIWPWTGASVFALVVWWIANAKSSGLRDLDVATGGAVTKTLPGNLSGYKTE